MPSLALGEVSDPRMRENKQRKREKKGVRPLSGVRPTVVPIPNTAIQPLSPDAAARATAWESCPRPINGERKDPTAARLNLKRVKPDSKFAAYSPKLS